MSDIDTVRWIRHPWAALFDLLLDVESYPSFLPYCPDVRLLSRNTEDPSRPVIVSRMSVGLGALQMTYANRTVADRGARRIEVESLDGPLRRLRVVWQFESGDDDCTRVEFSARYEFT